MRLGRANRAHDTFTHTGDDRFLGRTANELVEIGTDRDSRFYLELNAVLSDGIERRAFAVLRRAIDHTRINAGLDRLEDIAPGKVDRRCPFEVEVDDLGLAGS